MRRLWVGRGGGGADEGMGRGEMREIEEYGVIVLPIARFNSRYISRDAGSQTWASNLSTVLAPKSQTLSNPSRRRTIPKVTSQPRIHPSTSPPPHPSACCARGAP